MKSPFPGMDPYLELHWRTVHQSLCVYAKDLLQPQIAPAMVAEVDTRLELQEDMLIRGRSFAPDVSVHETSGVERAGRPESATATLTEPLIVEIAEAEKPRSFVRIRENDRYGRLITVIEFLSPSNKRKAGREEFMTKQRDLMTAAINIVEVDLIRGGEWSLNVPISQVQPRPTYCISVHRAGGGNRWAVYPTKLTDNLPTIAIPLRDQDPDARLDLQSLVDRVYANSGYGEWLYEQPLEPAPTVDERPVIEKLVSARLKPAS